MWADPRLGRWSRTNALIAEAAARQGARIEEICDVHGDALVWLVRGEKRVMVAKTRSPFLGAVANKLANHKYASGAILRAAGLPVIDRILVEDLDDPAQAAAARQALTAWGRVVVKPNWGNRGVGIVPGVTTWDGLIAAVEAATALDDDEEALIEPELPWESVRVAVIGGDVSAACVVRRPVLEGEGTIRELLADLDRDPRRGRWQDNAVSPLDRVEPDAALEAVLAARGLSLDAPLPPGERFPLLIEEQETIDVTDTLDPRWKAVAVAACRRLDVDVGGVDLLVDGDQGVLLEVNCLPALHLHALPTQGAPRPVFDAFVSWCLR